MDFSRKHRTPDDDAFGDPRAVPVVVSAEFLSGPLQGTFVAWDDMTDEERAAWEGPAPRPCYRSVWDVYGLRRRPRTSRSRRR